MTTNSSGRTLGGIGHQSDAQIFNMSSLKDNGTLGVPKAEAVEPAAEDEEDGEGDAKKLP